MRVMVLVKATKESEAGNLLPSTELLEAMGRYTDSVRRKVGSRIRAGRSLLRLGVELAEVRDDARPATGPAGRAGVAAVQDQPVVGAATEVLRHPAQ